MFIMKLFLFDKKVISFSYFPSLNMACDRTIFPLEIGTHTALRRQKLQITDFVMGLSNKPGKVCT